MINDYVILSVTCEGLLSFNFVASGIEGIDVIAADVTDDASLEEMCSKATVLISCVGPVGGISISLTNHNIDRDLALYYDLCIGTICKERH